MGVPKPELGKEWIHALVSILLVCASAPAAEYSFEVPNLEMQVWVHPDASVRIVYDIQFRNNRFAHPIDVVDIGVPHEHYDLRQVRASMGGQRLGDIRPSIEVHPGFEVHLDAQTIQPENSGTLHVEFPVPDMVWQDTTRADYASLQVVPVWFGARYVTGTTRLRLAVHFPPGVKPEEVLHQGLNFTHKARVRMAEEAGQEACEHTVVAWDSLVRLVQAYKFGVSFPKRDLQRVLRITPLDLLLKWFGESTEARVIAGIAFLVLFGFLFFRFSGGTGVSVFMLLSAGAALAFAVSPGLHLLSFPLVVVLIAIDEWLLGRRKGGYMPPIASVEGGGIKRGLTAPEAAVILKMPLSKILGLAIFGLLKKGVLRQVQAEPLAVEVDPEFRVPEGTLPAACEKYYREAAQRRGVPLHRYEFPLVSLIQNRPGVPLSQIDCSLPLKRLLEQAAARMAGFDLERTREYYRAIVRRAAEQAGAIADIPQREKQIDRDFEWILLDPRSPDVFNYGRPYRPPWIRTGAGSSGGASAGGGNSGGGSTPAAPSIPGQTTFGEVSASFSGWAENAMDSLASSISPASMQVKGATGGFINLSGVDHVTGELFNALAEASAKGGGGSGGGGGCACACAGCACACACAGGGR